jgi:NAD(P)-dependent dehydrogenase (short-subunit alcohol dehydrogenase family)
MSKPVALIFGAGPKVGAAVANAFTNEGYAVAIASRSANDAEHPDAQGLLSVKADLAKTEDVKRAFERTKIKLGTPSVVIHNGERAVAFLVTFNTSG